MRKFSIFIFIFIVLSGSMQAQDADSRTVVAWNTEDGVFIWEAGDNEARQVATLDADVTINRLLLAPDGQHIALLQWTPAEDETSAPHESVVIIDTAPDADPQMRTLFESSTLYPDLESEDGILVIRLAWVNATTLYFNTYAWDYEYIGRRNYDLWRADITTSDVTQMFPPMMGGDFVASPDGMLLAVINPGSYQATDASITITDTRIRPELEPRIVMTYPAVATGSEVEFIPPIAWLDDRTLWTAIPDPDLIYDLTDNPPPVQLWELDAVSGEATHVGEVDANFFGLPSLSPDGSRIVYMKHPQLNSFDIYVADRNGQNPQIIGNNTATPATPLWISDDTFIYWGESVRFVQTIGSDPQPFPNDGESGAVQQVLNADNGDLVYLSGYSPEPFQLRLINLANIGGDSTLIAELGETYPRFDVVVVGE